MPASRYNPGTAPRRGLILQPRDFEILATVLKYRLVTSDHLHALLFVGRSRRVVQARLRLLFEHRLLNRLFVPVVLAAAPWHGRALHRPLYAVSAKGLQLLRETGPMESTLNRRRSAPSYSAATLFHHVVVTDCLISLSVALRSHPDLEAISTVTEADLWPDAISFKASEGRVVLIVPDGAFTLRHRATGKAMTFYLEVVRADVSGGNRRLQEKFARYATWSHERLFQQVYGHKQIRAVLIATTSPERAEHFRKLAEKLTHGRNLFWFASYEERCQDGNIREAFTPESILTLNWQTANQSSRTIFEAMQPPVAL